MLTSLRVELFKLEVATGGGCSQDMPHPGQGSFQRPLGKIC